MTESNKDYDAIDGECLVHDPIDGKRYPLSDLKGRYVDRRWEENGYSRAQVIEAGGYKVKKPNGKTQFIPVPRAKLSPEYPETCGRKAGTNNTRKPTGKKGGRQVADPAPDVAISFLDELASSRTMIKGIRKHSVANSRLEEDLTSIPFFDPDAPDTWTKGVAALNNANLHRLHPQARMLVSLQKGREKAWTAYDGGRGEGSLADALKADKLFVDAMDRCYARLDKGFDSVFKALTQMDKIKEAFAKSQETDASGKSIGDDEKKRLLAEAEEMGIDAEFIVIAGDKEEEG